MTWFWRGLLWLVLALIFIPSLAFVGVIIVDLTMDCELNPYAGFTCPEWTAWLVVLAVPGILMIVPALAIALIYAVFALWIRIAKRGHGTK